MPTAVVVVAARPPGVSVAELIAAAAFAEVEFDALCAPAASSPPADTVTAAAGALAAAGLFYHISEDRNRTKTVNVP
jgi:hypothetical protein